ncbi:MAG TPA: glycosyltransferase family 4 protein [Planctomycetota bacterium]|nr:glycosyltransferase family 4 protein [Planctomycetota bacterium]
MARIKVLEVLEANVGGARKHVLQLLRGLDRARFDMHLACSVERDQSVSPELDALRAEGVRVSTVRMLRRPAPLSDFAALRTLCRLMRTERYDLVHTHASKAGFLGRLAARRAGVPAVVHTPHTFPFERHDTVLAPLYKVLERLAARWADRLVLVSASQREVAERAGLGPSHRLVVIPNGIRLPEREPAAARRKFRAELGLRDADRVVALVGRLAPQKDVQTFLSVARELTRALPEARLLLVGAADNSRYVRGLRPRISEAAWRVAFGGQAPAGAVPWAPDLPLRLLGERPDAAELVAAVDVVILPSLYEGLPYSLLEAMAQRVPVVASRVTGNVDVIEHGRSGFLAPVGDVSAFANYALKLLADEACRAGMGEAARARVAAEFTEERFLRQMAELYETLLER